MSNISNLPNFEILTEFDKQWGKQIAHFNFTQVPNALFNCQGHLDISDGELLTFLHLTMFRFHNYSEVFPRIKTLCEFSNSGYSTVQKRLKSLEDKQMIKRKRRINSSNVYDLTPCISKLSKHLKNCPRTPHGFSKAPLNFSVSDPSVLTYKEDQPKILTTNKTVTISRTGMPPVVIY